MFFPHIQHGGKGPQSWIRVQGMEQMAATATALAPTQAQGWSSSYFPPTITCSLPLLPTAYLPPHPTSPLLILSCSTGPALAQVTEHMLAPVLACLGSMGAGGRSSSLGPSSRSNSVLGPRPQLPALSGLAGAQASICSMS